MSLKAGAKRPPPSLLSELVFDKQQVGKWETCFWFSTFPRPVAAVGMWESRSDFQGLWARRKTCLWFSSASTDRHFHGPPVHAVHLRSGSKLANKRRLACCILCAASRSLCARACCSRACSVTPAFKCLATSGSCRRICHGVAYQRYTRFCFP